MMHLQSWSVVCFLLFISQQTSFLFRQIDVHIIVTVITIFDIKFVISFINFTLSVAIGTLLLSRKCKCNAGIWYTKQSILQGSQIEKTQVSFYNLGVNNKGQITERLLGQLIRDQMPQKLEEFKGVYTKYSGKYILSPNLCFLSQRPLLAYVLILLSCAKFQQD